jgi:tripartite-type tricarboxylate transporter receptor subunit TctC
VDNRPGAGGIVAGQALMGAPADGHTLLVASNGTAISRGLFRTLPFDPLADFAPVVTMGAFPIGIVAPPGAPNRDTPPGGPDRDLPALLARLRANPGRLNIGTIAAGSTQNLSAELFKIRSGTRFETVPFNGTPALITAMLRGDVDAAFEITGPIAGPIEAGAVRLLAVTSATRSAQYPNVPTVQEAGVPDYDVASWNALMVRAGTPPALIATLNRAANEALAGAELRATLARAGVEPRGGTAAEMGALLAADTARWTETIEKAGIQRQ